jgi:hypothetical protein
VIGRSKPTKIERLSEKYGIVVTPGDLGTLGTLIRVQNQPQAHKRR